MREEIQTVCSHVTTGKAIQEQVVEYREATAVMRERLEATRIELATAKCEVANLLQKDEEHLRQIHEFEAEIIQAKRQSAETPVTMLRLSDLEVAKKELESQISGIRREADDLAQQVQHKTDEGAHLATLLSGLQLQLEDARATQETLRTERLEYEQHVQTERANDRRILSEATDSAIARLQSKLENEKQQLAYKVEEAEKEIRKLTARQEYNLTDNYMHKEQVVEAQKALDAVKAEKYEEVISSNLLIVAELLISLSQMEISQTLRETIKAQEAKLNDRDQQRKTLQSRISLLEEELDGSLLQKNDLQAKLNRAKQESETRKARHATRSVESNGTQTSPAKHVVQPKKSRLFSQLPAEIEDSQAREGLPLDALQGIMNDPFSNVHHDEQQLETDDFTSLFPSTPDIPNVREARSHMFTSQTETRVVSRRSHTMQPTSSRHQSSRTRKDFESSHSAAQDTSATVAAHAASHAHSAYSGYTSNEHNARENPASHSLASNGRAPAQRKRDVAAAGFTRPSSAAKKSRRQNSHLQQLGPVIGDSQSPNHSRLLGGRGRKLSSKGGKKTWHGGIPEGFF